MFRSRHTALALALGLFACEGFELTAVDAASRDGEVSDGATADARSPTDGGPSLDSQPPEDLAGFVEWQMAAGGLPGLAAGLVVDGEVAYVGTWGWADVENEVPVADDTLFVVASVSKLFTGVPLMRLVEEGRLDLDASTADAFGFSLVNPAFPDVPITTRQLLTHTSGMVDDWLTLGGTTYRGDPPIDLGQFARGYARPGGDLYDPDHFGSAPGTDWRYCNAAFAVAGHLAEIGWDEDFRALTARQILVPLGLNDTGWFFEDLDASRLASLYTYDARRGGSFVALDQVNYAHYPAGGLRSSIRDLLRYARAWLAEGELDGERFLEPETIRAMYAQQVPALSERQALVLRYDTVGGRTFIGHSGAGIGGSANFLMLPEQRAALIVVSNGDAYVRARLGQPQGREAFEAILVRLGEELEAQMAP